MKKLLFLVNVDWFFLSHRLPIALAALQAGYEVHIATRITDRKKELLSHRLIVHELPIVRGKTNIKTEIITFIKIVQVLREVKPDILHTVTIKPVLFGGIAAKFARIKRVVAAISGLGYVFIEKNKKNNLRKKFISILYKLAFEQPLIKVIFQNQDDKSVLTKIKALRDSQTIIIPGSGINLNTYAYLPEPNLPYTTVIMVSRLLADKGVHEFVEAAREIHKKELSVRFQLVGNIDPDNPASISAQQIQVWQNEGIVELLGHRTDIADLFSQANAVVLPSYREGFPKVLIEAAACGRAVVTTDVPGCRDAIIPNKTGLLVPVQDANTLAKAIEHLILNLELRLRMGKAGRQLAEEKYDIHQVVQTHLNIYEELLSQST